MSGSVRSLAFNGVVFYLFSNGAQMHKGRAYELWQEGRTWCGQPNYPRWLAASYEYAIDPSFAWQGTPPLPADWGPWTIVPSAVDRAAGTFSYRVSIGTFGGREVEVGMYCQLVNDNTVLKVDRMVWVDGVMQMEQMSSLGYGNDFETFDGNGRAQQGLPGAQIWNPGVSVADAILY